MEKQGHSEAAEAQYMPSVHHGGLHSQNKHDRHTDSRFRLLQDFVYYNGKQVLCAYSMVHVTAVLHVRNEDELADTYTYMLR